LYGRLAKRQTYTNSTYPNNNVTEDFSIIVISGLNHLLVGERNLGKRTVFGIITTLLVVSVLSSTFNVQLSRAEANIQNKPVAMESFLSPPGWNKTYGGTGDDRVPSVIQTSDKGYAMAGRTKSYGAGSDDFWLVKTDSFGNAQWNKTYGGTGGDIAWSVIQTGDGGYAIAGWNGANALLVKTDSSGNMQWNKTYGGLGSDVAWSVIQTGDGGYAIGGETSSYGAGSVDSWLIKTDSSGNAQWNKTYGGTNLDTCRSLIKTSDGGYALVGYTNSYGAGNLDFWLVKTDSSGNAQWNKTYGGTNYDIACSVVQTIGGGYAIAGYTNSYGVGSDDFWLVKTDSAGNAQWNKTYGGAGYDDAWSVIQTIDEGYALTGYTDSYGAGSTDVWLVKTNSIGNMLWNVTYGGITVDAAYSIVKTSDGGYALAGETKSYGAGGDDFWLIKLAGTTYIRADGSVDPPTAPIQRNGDLYTLTGNISSVADGIVIERNNMTLDGAGYMIQGGGGENGVHLSGRNNVTIQHTKIKDFGNGVRVEGSNNVTITNNVVSSCWGIVITSGNNDKIVSNVISQSDIGIGAISQNNLIIQSNIIADTEDGIQFGGSGSTIIGNIISNNSQCGIYIAASVSMNWGTSNVIKLNDILNNQLAGIRIYNVEAQAFHNNSIYHNNMVNNTQQITSNSALGANNWDDGYPSGGNYWSDYNGTDLYRGVYQNITGSDGLGDTYYTINASNTDHYPLMGSCGSSTGTGSNVTVFPTADVCLIFENVTEAGSTTVDRTSVGPSPPPGLELVGQFYDVKVTASYSGNITVRIIYDDSGMTQQEESTLRLLQWCLDPCDITGATPGVPDGICDMRDIGYLCTKFMTTPSSPDWDPKCDVSGPTTGVPDGIVDMRDIGFACSHFGLTSKWVNITTFIDTQNNLIYGETSHFSLIGIHRE